MNRFLNLHVVLLLLSPCGLRAAESPNPVKVFILAGQSNMEGQGVVDLKGKDYNEGKGTLAALMADPAKAPMFRHLEDAQGKWVVRDDVWVRLINLIKDVRRELNAPRLPVVIGELTGPWVGAPPEWTKLRQAQSAAAAHPEFAGTVTFVETHNFVRKPEESPNPGHGHHEFGNAETYFLVGDALGNGMKKLLGGKTAASHRPNAIEGWRVLISERLLAQDKAATEKAIELLRTQLQEIVRVVPAPAVAALREVTLWFSPEYPGVQPRAEYHPGAGWLRDNGRDPAMVKGVEFTDVRRFEAETKRMPNFTLHELAHAYHDRVLAGGFGHAEIKAAYERAKAGGLYDKVERWFGNGRPKTTERAYAMANPMEYFAETTEAFFSRNDFFPFTRDELMRHDPEMFELLAKLWGVTK